MSYDARAIANILLDLADTQDVKLTNLSINKLIYFIHAWYLARTGTPLISAKIEAWDYGPVIREVYSEFKRYEAAEIKGRASRFDVDKLQRTLVTDSVAPDDMLFIQDQFRRYGHLSASKLVGMSHEKGGPWDLVFNAAGKTNPGMEISNELIQAYFVRQTRH